MRRSHCLLYKQVTSLVQNPQADLLPPQGEREASMLLLLYAQLVLTLITLLQLSAMLSTHTSEPNHCICECATAPCPDPTVLTW